MGLVFQAVLSFIPVKQRPQDGGKTILSKRAHSADQLWGNIGSDFRKLFISTNCTAQNESELTLCTKWNISILLIEYYILYTYFIKISM